jgi:hypothetical protein
MIKMLFITMFVLNKSIYVEICRRYQKRAYHTVRSDVFLRYHLRCNVLFAGAEADDFAYDGTHDCTSMLLFEVFGAQEIIVGTYSDEGVRTFCDNIRQHLGKATVTSANIKTFNRRRQQFGSKIGDNVKVDLLSGTISGLRSRVSFVVDGQDYIVLELLIKQRVRKTAA